jgi:hypothetical protein
MGGEAWFGKITDSLAETYVRPDTRYEIISKFDGFIAEALSYKPIDREVVKSRDLILSDGQAYNVYMDPHAVAARHMWRDIEKYNRHGAACHNINALKVKLSSS